VQVTRRLLILLPVAALAKERLGDIPAPPDDWTKMNPFADAYSAYVRLLDRYVKDTKLWERTYKLWNKMLGL
jgi:hypothetical protein